MNQMASTRITRAQFLSTEIPDIIRTVWGGGDRTLRVTSDRYISLATRVRTHVRFSNEAWERSRLIKVMIYTDHPSRFDDFDRLGDQLPTGPADVPVPFGWWMDEDEERRYCGFVWTHDGTDYSDAVAQVREANEFLRKTLEENFGA